MQTYSQQCLIQNIIEESDWAELLWLKWNGGSEFCQLSLPLFPEALETSPGSLRACGTQCKHHCSRIWEKKQGVLLVRCGVCGWRNKEMVMENLKISGIWAGWWTVSWTGQSRGKKARHFGCTEGVMSREGAHERLMGTKAGEVHRRRKTELYAMAFVSLPKESHWKLSGF